MLNLTVFCAVSFFMSVVVFLILAFYIRTRVKFVSMTADQAEREAIDILYEINK